jgi:chitinase
MLAPSLGVARILVIPLLLAYLVTAVSVPDSLSSYLAAHPISTTSGDLTKAPVALSNLSTKALPPVVANSARSRCPASCDDAGLDPINWTVYHDVNRLSWCNKTMLLDFALYNSLDDPRTHASIRCCAASPEAAASRVDKRGNATSGTSCLPKGNQTQVQESLQMAFNGSDASGSTNGKLLGPAKA